MNELVSVSNLIFLLGIIVKVSVFKWTLTGFSAANIKIF